MAQVLFAGGRLDSLSILGGAPVNDTTAGSFDPAYSDSAATCAQPADIVQATQVNAAGVALDLSGTQTGWYHTVYFTQGNPAAGNMPMFLVDSAGNPWVAVRTLGTTQLALYYNSGTGASPVWTQVGTIAYSHINYTRLEFDLRLTLGSPHTAEFYVNRSLLTSGTFTQAALTTIRGMRLSTIGNAVSCYYSQIFITEGIPTIGAKVKSCRATAAGTNTGWTGAYTDVNEPVNSDTTVNTATTAGLRQTYPITALTVPAGYTINTVMHVFRAKNDGTTPVNLKSAVRRAATNYDNASNVSGLGLGFSPILTRYDTDPSTAAAWTQANFNAAEFGYLSVT